MILTRIHTIMDGKSNRAKARTACCTMHKKPNVITMIALLTMSLPLDKHGFK